MFNKFKNLFASRQQHEEIDRYIEVPANELNEDFKRHIIELEKLGEKFSKVIENEYKSKFECAGKQNLKVWVCRDIDGDEIPGLSCEQCLEGEYRSQVAINFDGFTDEEDAYAYYIQLWYYFSGGRKGIGTLYDSSKHDLESDIKERLEILLKEV